MKPVGPDFSVSPTLWAQAASSIAGQLQEQVDVDREGLRHRLIERGYAIQSLDIPGHPKVTRVLAVDSSLAVKRYRFQTLWGVHGVAGYAVFDGKDHEDRLVGGEPIPYDDVRADSRVALGILHDAWDLSAQTGTLRTAEECRLIVEGLSALESEGRAVDAVLFDGSIATTLRSLAEDSQQGEAAARARRDLDAVLADKAVVGMVEDSHATDVSSSLGLSMSNLMLAELALSPLEYFSVMTRGVQVYYGKLPEKKVPFSPSGVSRPVTIRWEIAGAGDAAWLSRLAGMWAAERDLVHSQLYPVRLTDYLTRRIDVGAIVDEVAAGCDLEPSFRDSREW